MAWVFPYDAVLFDLDGVVTDTARVHASAWKSLFDGFLSTWDKKSSAAVPFDLEKDYLSYVDGKPRFEGVDSFLRSRGISIPFGKSDDDPGQASVCGLGNRKDLIFLNELNVHGVEVFDSSRRLILDLKKNGIKTAVVSSSKNCRRVLQVAGIEGLFDVRVDGQVAASLGLKGKPAPDMFLKAAEQMNVLPSGSIVIEDSVSGVQSGFRGAFGLIVGVDRAGNNNLLGNGADVVYSDLREVSPLSLEGIFRRKAGGAV